VRAAASALAAAGLLAASLFYAFTFEIVKGEHVVHRR